MSCAPRFETGFELDSVSSPVRGTLAADHDPQTFHDCHGVAPNGTLTGDMATTCLPAAVAEQGSVAELCEQFILSQTSEAPDAFDTDRLGPWTLATHPTLPIVAIREVDARPGERPDAARLGWLLGYPVTSEGRLLRAGATVTVPAGDDPLELVESLGGRFLAVFVNGANPAIYTDAAASYGSVFSASLRIAASTPGLIPYAETTGDRVGLIELLGVPQTNSMYPLALTPRHDVCQLLPNHHLDLHTWTMVRHGPRWQERGSVAVDDSVSRIAELIKRHIAAVMDAYPCYLPLTAGSDSRMLLACARERRAELGTYTLRIPDLSGSNDVRVASRISAGIGVPHLKVSMPKLDPDDLTMWLYRTSCGVGEPRGMRAATALRTLDRSRVHLGGNIGDLAHNEYWATVDENASSVTIEQLALHAVASVTGGLDAGQRRAAESTEVLGEIERWRDSAGAPDDLALLDLLYVENRLGCWAGIWPYAQFFGPGFMFFPMCHREIIDLMLFLPEAVRRSGELNTLVIRQEWPELLERPFNSPSRPVRAAHLPRRVVGGVRRRARHLVRRSAR